MRLPTGSSCVIEIFMVNAPCKTMETLCLWRHYVFGDIMSLETLCLSSLAWLYNLRTTIHMASTPNNIYTLNLKPFLLRFRTSLLPSGSLILSLHATDFLLSFNFLSNSPLSHFFLISRSGLFVVVFLSKVHFHALHMSPFHFSASYNLSTPDMWSNYQWRFDFPLSHTLSPWEVKLL